MNSIVIDCGASFIKAAKFDKNGIMIKDISYSTKNQIDLVIYSSVMYLLDKYNHHSSLIRMLKTNVR